MMDTHAQIYSVPMLYDLAFSYRDFEAECDFLQLIFRRQHGRDATRFLELAAGPAGHSIAMATRGLSCAALDRSDEMVAYGRRKASAARVALDYTLQDMSCFDVGRNFELAACMLDSASYLLTDDQFLAHLVCVARALERGGIYVLELGHPDDVGDGERTKQMWSVEDSKGELQATWCAMPDSFDAESRSTLAHAHLVYRTHAGEELVVDDHSRQRGFTEPQLRRLVAESGAFRVLEIFGAFDTAVPLASPEGAWRMIPVLQRC